MEGQPIFSNSLVSSRRCIHTASHFIRASGFPYLQEVGELTALSPHVSRRSDLDSYLFFVVTNGKGILKYRGEYHELSSGDCVFINCKNGYEQCSSEKEPWSLSWVHFNSSAMLSVYEKYRERGGCPVFRTTDARRDEYVRYTESIHSVAAARSHTVDMELAGMLTNLLNLLMQDAWESKTEKNDVKASKRMSLTVVVEYIDANYTHRLTLDDIAGKFYINKQYLAKIFKENYGVSVGNYIQQLRVGKAKELLRFGDADTGRALSIEAVAAAVGIDDPNYFSRIFRKTEGISPKKYRDSW